MRHQLIAVGATLTAGGLLLAWTPSPTSAASPQTSQANAALRYLYGQLGPDGSIAAAAGTTEDTIISDADNGYDPATLRSSSGASAYAYLSAHASAINTAGAAAKYVLTWAAAGKPSAIDASGVLAKLNTSVTAGGFLEPNGAFHNPDPTLETANAYSQALAVLADVAGRHALPAQATAWLLCAQRTDGGFGYAISDATTSPPPFCGDTSSDTNDSAIILQALAAAGSTSADAAARTYLHNAQQSNGGFAFTATGSTDPDSDAVVIQALLAIGEDPAGAAWTKNGATPLSDLESFADPHGTGGYVFPGRSAPDAFTTAAIPQALALEPYGAATTFVPRTAPTTAAIPPSSSPTSAPAAAAGTVPVPDTGSAQAVPGQPAFPCALVALGCLALCGSLLLLRRSAAP